MSPLSTLQGLPTVLLLRARGLRFCPPHSRPTEKVPAGVSTRVKCGDGKMKRVLVELKEKRWIGSSNTRVAVTVTKWDSQWQVAAGAAVLRELPRPSGRNAASWDPWKPPAGVRPTTRLGPAAALGLAGPGWAAAVCSEQVTSGHVSVSQTSGGS